MSRKTGLKKRVPSASTGRRSISSFVVSAFCILAALTAIGLATGRRRNSNGVDFNWISQRSANSTPVYQFEVIETFPHDRNAFSQGLDFDGVTLFESTGGYGKSSVRRVNLETGRVEKWLRLDKRLFGEGLTLFDDKLIQITWKRGLGYVYDAKTLRLIRKFSYAGEGWGLTHDGTHFIMSDGSDRLKFRHPDSFSVVRTIRVRDGNRAIRQLNELEFVDGRILANVWHSDRIAMIDPANGRVTGWIDLSGLLAKPLGPESVLNGIAYKDGRLFVTGKNWPNLFEIKLTNK